MKCFSVSFQRVATLPKSGPRFAQPTDFVPAGPKTSLRSCRRRWKNYHEYYIYLEIYIYESEKLFRAETAMAAWELADTTFVNATKNIWFEAFVVEPAMYWTVLLKPLNTFHSNILDVQQLKTSVFELNPPGGIKTKLVSRSILN